jgi:head-tail adaptor
MDAEAGEIMRKVRIERPIADDSLDGAGSGNWVLVKEVWAAMKDVQPSRDERLADGMTIATRRSRVRIWRRPEVTASMRIVVKATGRIMQIIGGPSDIEGGARLEMMAEDYSTPGNPA